MTQYAIEILKDKLRFELSCRYDAENWQQDPDVMHHKGDKEAFEESLRLANERIPQLKKAIEILTHE